MDGRLATTTDTKIPCRVIESLPEDLNMVTMQSIISADLDTSTTEWIEAQLSTGSSGPSTASGEVNGMECSGDDRTNRGKWFGVH